MKVFDVFDDLFQSCKDGKTAVIGIVSVKNVEGYRFRHCVIGKVASGHGQLIEVHDHADIACIKLRHHINPSLS